MSYYLDLWRHSGFRSMIWQWFYNHQICPDCLKRGRFWQLFPFHEHEER